MVNINQKILVTFNKYFYDLIEDLQAINEQLKTVVSSVFQVRQMKTDKNISFLTKSLDPSMYKELTNTTDTQTLFTTGSVAGLSIFPGVTMEFLANGTDKDHHPTILSYIYVLVLLATIYNFENENENQNENENKERLEIVEELFNNAMEIVCGIEKNEDYSKALNNIYDADILGLLVAMGTLQKEKKEKTDKKTEDNTKDNTENNTEVPGVDPFMDKMKNVLQGSKIGQFTNEIMAELTNEMKDDMNDVSSIDDFMKSGKVGNVINKTVQYFDKKNKSGEFNQEDIMKECANLMGVFGNTMPGASSSASSSSPSSSPSPPPPAFNMNDLQNIMKLFSSEDKFKLDPSKLQKEETKNRLRKKLEAKKSIE